MADEVSLFQLFMEVGKAHPDRLEDFYYALPEYRREQLHAEIEAVGQTIANVLGALGRHIAEIERQAEIGKANKESTNQ